VCRDAVSGHSPQLASVYMSCPKIGLHKVNENERTKNKERALACADF